MTNEKIWRFPGREETERKLTALATSTAAVITLSQPISAAKPTGDASTEAPVCASNPRSPNWLSDRVFHLNSDNVVNSFKSGLPDRESFRNPETALNALMLQIPSDSPIAALAAHKNGWAGSKSRAPGRGLQLRAQEFLESVERKYGSAIPQVAAGPQDYISFTWRLQPDRCLTVGLFDEGKGQFTCDWVVLQSDTVINSQESDVFSLNFLMSAVDNFLNC